MYACTYTHKHMLSPSFLFLFNDALNPLHFFFFFDRTRKEKENSNFTLYSYGESASYSLANQVSLTLSDLISYTRYW